MPGKSILPLSLSPHQKLVKTSSEWVGTAIRRLNPQSEVTCDFLAAHDIVLPVPLPLQVGKKAKKTLSNADPESENKAVKMKPSGLFQNIFNKLKGEKDTNPAPPSPSEEPQEDVQGRTALELSVTEESAEEMILPAEPINSDVQVLRMQLTFILEKLPAYAWFGCHPFDPTEWAGIFENLQRVAYKRLNVLLAQSQPFDPDETHQRILYNGIGRGKKGWRAIRALSRSEFDKTVLLGCTVADPCSPAPNELLQSELKSLLVLLHRQQIRYLSVKNPVPILRFGVRHIFLPAEGHIPLTCLGHRHLLHKDPNPRPRSLHQIPDRPR